MASVQQRNQIVFLSSKYADVYNNSTTSYLSDVTFRLPRPIQKPKGTTLCVKLEQFVFNNSFTIINNENNTLDIELDGTPITYTLTAGNYTEDEFVDLLNNLMGVDDFVVDYDENTGLLKWTHDTHDFEFLATSTCFEIIGFKSDGVTSYPSATQELEAIYPLNLSGKNVIYVALSNLSINNINGNVGQRTNVINSIPIDAQAGSNVFYINYTDSKSFTQEEIISEINVKVYRQDLSTLIDFRNQHWYMTLEVSYYPA